MDNMPEHAPDNERERKIVWAAYILHAVSFFTGGLSSIAAVIINHIKYAESHDPLIASHHRWMLRTFWFALLWAAICIPLAIFLIGFVGFAIVTVWIIYRLVRGILALVDNN